MGPPSSLIAAVTIEVKKGKSTVLYIYIFFVGSGSTAVAAQWRQRGGGSAAASASLVVEAAAWQKCNFGGSSSPLGSAVAARG